MLYNWYLRDLFEFTKYNQNTFANVNPAFVSDPILLDIICELTGLTEPQVIDTACSEIQKRVKNFNWNFDNYFIGMRLELHPYIRDELRRALYILQNKQNCVIKMHTERNN